MIANPVVLVVYDAGSLAPTRLAEVARRNGCDLVFVAADTQHARDMRPTLEMIGRVVDTAGRPEAELLAELRGLRAAGIVAFSEFQLVTTVRLAAALGLRYHSPDDVPAITRKDLQRARLAEAGVDAVRFRTVSRPDQAGEALAHVGLPAIVKPVVGAASRNTMRVDTAAQARAVLTEVLAAEPEVMLEELLAGRAGPAPWGDYIAVDCVADGGDVRPVFTTSKFALAPPFRERGGYGGRSVVPETELRAVRDLACRAVRALRVHGVADVEIKLTDRGPRVIEVNGRLGAWVDDLAVRSGVADPADVAIRAALGRDHEQSCEKPDQDDVPIAFHYLLVPPPAARRVRAIRGVAGLRRIPHVERVYVLAEPGADADWRIGARSNVAAVLGSVRDHGQLAATVATIEDADWIDYD